MNSSNSMGDNHPGDDGNSVGSVSRSGRVRKKNSLLAVYESPDVIEKRGRKPNTINRSGNKARSHGKSQSRTGGKSYGYYQNVGPPRVNSYSHDEEPLSPLGMMHEPYDGEVPDIAAEEIIDEGLLDEEDGAMEITSSVHHRHVGNNIRLKSQAQSTYMMEKSMKQRKMTGQTSGTKIKATRKDKGSPRVTAYMLWAKEQRAIFAKKYPNLDFSTVSKKLSDLWATVPQNQKRMWKTKAAKIMKKKANGAENMKNSAGPSLILARKVSVQTVRKGMKNTTPEEIHLPKRPPGRPPKKNIHFLNPTLSTPGPSPKTNIYNNHNSTSSSSQFSPKLLVNSKPRISSGPVLAPVSTIDDIKPEPYKYKVTGTDSLDVAAHLSLLGESMKKLGAQLQSQNLPDHPVNESLSSLLDSLLCSVGPILCLTQLVPELDCIPESKLKSILNNVGYVMPGL